KSKPDPPAAPPVVSLDRYLPLYDISDRNERKVEAPASVTYSVARSVDLQRSTLIRAVLQSRSFILREPLPERRPFMEQVHAMGWSLLAEVPGRAMVFGAVSRPWEEKVKLQPLTAKEFLAFRRPGWAKIVWTLEVDPVGRAKSLFRTQTRVATTDGGA